MPEQPDAGKNNTGDCTPLSTIIAADEIIVMQDGQIIERGSHNDLIEVEEGVYRRLTQLQKLHKTKNEIL